LIPDGVVQLAINPANGLALEGGPEGQGGVPEYFYKENIPSPRRPEDSLSPDASEKSLERVKNQLF
jgi:hypothetical protein